jgi:CRISPR-associated protein (TIGR02710 family)
MVEPTNRSKGAIMTVGLTDVPLTYSLRQIRPAYAAFLCTPGSAPTLDKVLTDSSLPPSQVQRREIADDPGQIGIVHEFYECFLWLRDHCRLAPSDIQVDPTAGRKWMSAGATMIASFLGLSMSYVEVQMREGQPVPETMRFVALGNAYDQTGFLEAEKGRELFNRCDFAAAADTFGKLTPLLSGQADLFAGLAKLSQVLHRWDLFQHYEHSLSAEFEEASRHLDRAAYSAADRSPLQAFVPDVRRLAHGIEEVTAAAKPALVATVDLLLNAERRLALGRYDDSIGRTYRALESLSQYYLSLGFGIDTGQADYSRWTDAQRADVVSALQPAQLPSRIGLEEGWRMLWALKHRGAEAVVDSGGKLRGDLRGVLASRNSSILAHGWGPVSERTAKTMIDRVRALLLEAEGEPAKQLMRALQIPHLPALWSRV